MDLISLLVTILVLLLVGGIIWWAASLAPIPAPLKPWLMFAVAVIFALIAVSVMLGGVYVPGFRRG